MRFNRAILLAVLAFCPLVASAQNGPFTVETTDAAPPEALAAPIKDVLDTKTGYRVLDSEGKPYATIWLRKAIPATSKPSGPKGAILYPFLSEGELLGGFQFATEGYDYRDQAILPGGYTLRYGLQPVNGDHLGVSPHRDFGLLLPAAKDTKVEPLAEQALEDRSAEAAGTSHPAVLMLMPADAGAEAGAVVRDDMNDTWGVVLPLSLEVKGESGASTQKVQLIVYGAAPL